MKHLQKCAAILICLLLAFACMAAAPSLGELRSKEVGVSVTASPDTLSAAGNVDITVHVVNNFAEFALYDVIVSGGGQEGSLGTIQPGEEKTHTMSVALSDAQLGSPIEFTVSYLESDQPASSSASVTVGRQVVEPSVDFRRSADKTSAAEGENITLTYRVNNVGSVGISDVAINDSIASRSIASGVSLDPGEEESFTYSHTMAGDAQSVPTLTYRANGQSYTKKLDSLSLTTADLNLTAQLEIITPPQQQGGTARFKATVSNVGTVDVLNVTVRDEQDAVLRSDETIAAGQNLEFEFDTVVEQTREVAISVSAEDADGHTIQAASRSIPIALESPQSQVNLTLTATATPLELSEPGDVQFELVIRNEGVQMSNVIISEEALGEVTSIPSLPVGEKRMTASLRMEQGGTFNFKLTAYDETGQTHEAFAQPITIEYTGLAAVETPLPEETPTEEQDVNSPSILIIVLVAIVVLIIAAAITLIVLIVKDRKRKRQMEAEEYGDDMYYDDEYADQEEDDDLYYEDEPEPEPEPEYYDEPEEAPQQRRYTPSRVNRESDYRQPEPPPRYTRNAQRPAPQPQAAPPQQAPVQAPPRQAPPQTAPPPRQATPAPRQPQQAPPRQPQPRPQQSAPQPAPRQPRKKKIYSEDDQEF